MSTVHNQADVGQIASKVLMPGDPLRAKFIAETFLLNPKLVNEVRNMYAFTGTYNGNHVTIMASGMGMPSIGIYSYELFTNYQVDSIIRIGSAGSYVKELDVYDVVLASSAWSESSYAKTQNGCEDDELFPSNELNDTIKSAANKLNIPLKEAKIHSSDVFYRDPSGGTFVELNQNHGVECVEMESFALFHNANVLEKKAACLLTISDSFVTNEATSPQERQEAFTQMIKVALETEI